MIPHEQMLPRIAQISQKLRSNKARGTADYEGRSVGFPTETVLGGSARDPFSKGSLAFLSINYSHSFPIAKRMRNSVLPAGRV